MTTMTNRGCNVETQVLVEIRKRIPTYVRMIIFIWPVFSVITAAIGARSIPYYTPSWAGALLGASAGFCLLAFPDNGKSFLIP